MYTGETNRQCQSIEIFTKCSVGRDADTAELKRAYRKLAMEFHPDRNPGDHEAESLQGGVGGLPGAVRSGQARPTIVSVTRARGRIGGGFHDVGDIFSAFSDIFGDLFGAAWAGAAAGPRAGRTSRCPCR